MTLTQVAMKAAQTTFKDHESCKSDKSRHRTHWEDKKTNKYLLQTSYLLRPSAVYLPQQPYAPLNPHFTILKIMFSYQESAKTQAASQIPSCSSFCFAFSFECPKSSLTHSLSLSLSLQLFWASSRVLGTLPLQIWPTKQLRLKYRLSLTALALQRKDQL